jgi:hypothetical protein
LTVIEQVAAQTVGRAIIGIAQANAEFLFEGKSTQDAAGAIPAAMAVSAGMGAIPQPPIAKAGIVGAAAAVG